MVVLAEGLWVFSFCFHPATIQSAWVIQLLLGNVKTQILVPSLINVAFLSGIEAI